MKNFKDKETNIEREREKKLENIFCCSTTPILR